MEDILKLTSSNRAGVRRVEIIFEEDIVNLPSSSPTSLYVEGSMSIAIGARPYFLYFTHQSSLFEEKGNITSKAGDYSTQSIKFKTPKDRPLLRDFITRLENNEFAVVYLDWNGYWKIVRRMRCKVDTTTNLFGSYNGATFNFSSKNKTRSKFWSWTDHPYVYVNPITNEITPVGTIGEAPPPDVDNTSGTGGSGTGGNTGGGTGGTGTGSTGTGDSDACIQSYTHDQSTAAAKWVITHELGDDTQRPRLVNASGHDLEAEGLVTRIWYKDSDTIEIDFSSAQSGTAYIKAFGDCEGGESHSDCCDGERVEFENFYEITIPAEKKLSSIAIWSALNKSISIGNINGSSEYVENALITANEPLQLNLGLFFLQQKKIYVSGSGAFKMKYYIEGCADGSESCCNGVKETATNSLAITIPAEKKLTSIEFWADADVLIQVGDTASSSEYIEDAEFLLSEVVASLDLGIFTLQEKIIYISAPGDFTIKYYIK